MRELPVIYEYQKSLITRFGKKHADNIAYQVDRIFSTVDPTEYPTLMGVADMSDKEDMKRFWSLDRCCAVIDRSFFYKPLKRTFIVCITYGH